MILDIVDYIEFSMKRRDSRSLWRIKQGALLLLLLAVLLGGCGGETPDQVVPVAPQTTEQAAAASSTPETMAPATPEDTPMPTPTATPPAPLAAMVNGQYLFLADFEQRVSEYQEALYEQGIDPNTAGGQEALRQARTEVLEWMIDTALIEQEAVALGISLTDEELEARVDQEIEAGGGQAAFEEWLQATGQTRDDFKEQLRQAIIVLQVQEAVTAGVGTEAEQVHVRHIMVDSPEAAQEIKAMLEGGADFATLARERSLDLVTKDNGGDLGWFPRGVVAEELENVSFGLQPGQLSDVLQLGDGYHIVQVMERAAAYPLSEEMQINLKSNRFDEWLAEKRALASIELFVSE